MSAKVRSTLTPDILRDRSEPPLRAVVQSRQAGSVKWNFATINPEGPSRSLLRVHSDLESMCRDEMLKILLQQYRPKQLSIQRQGAIVMSYSITSSARVRNVSGMVNPIVFAV
jgi:hypothetical protein